MTVIEKILSDYEAGAITRRERVAALARVITPETVEATFATLPREVVEELLDWARAAPLAGGVTVGGEVSREAARQSAEQHRVAALAIRGWQEHSERRGAEVQPDQQGATP
jgi:hypothetical protein